MKHRWFEMKHRWFEMKHRWFEMKHRWFEMKHRCFKTQHRWFKTKHGCFRTNTAKLALLRSPEPRPKATPTAPKPSRGVPTHLGSLSRSSLLRIARRFPSRLRRNRRLFVDLLLPREAIRLHLRVVEFVVRPEVVIEIGSLLHVARRIAPAGSRVNLGNDRRRYAVERD
jgi:hypothetical protein